MFHTYLINPIYNAFIYLIGIMPYGDVGFAIIAITLIIRTVFYPLFASSIRTQMGMQAIQGELDEINKKYKDNTEERGRKTMELFKKHNVRPFSAFLSILVQIPVFIALYYAFFHVGLPTVASELLYPFVHAPAVINTNFLGILDLLMAHNVILAILVAALQYVVAKISLTRIGTPPAGIQAQAHALQRNMMLFFLPALMGVISYTLPAAVGVYFAASSIISIGQEWFIQRQLLAAQKH